MEKEVKKYFLASFIYHKDTTGLMDPIMSDIEFDKLCKNLYDNFDKIDKKYQILLDKELLEQGSGSSIDFKNKEIQKIIIDAFKDYEEKKK